MFQGLLIASMSLFRFGSQAVLMESDKAFFVMGTTLAATVTSSCLLLTYLLGRSWDAQHTHLVSNLPLWLQPSPPLASC